MGEATTPEALLQALTGYIGEQLRDLGEDDQFSPDDDLAMIGFDSIAYVRLLAFIKDRFGLEVPDADVTIENFGNVSGMVNYLSTLGPSRRSNHEAAS